MNNNSINRFLLAVHVLPTNPCEPSPCGPYSQCRVVDGHAVCSCDIGYIGTPPTCKPECIVSSECPQDKACKDKKCVDPCPNTCGVDAKCQVVNHNPICSCMPGFTGDPFVLCTKLESKHVLFFSLCTSNETERMCLLSFFFFTYFQYHLHLLLL